MFLLQYPAILASDPDSGENGQVTFTLAGWGSQWFTVDNNTGEIVVKDGGNMDREEYPTLELTVSKHSQKISLT